MLGVIVSHYNRFHVLGEAVNQLRQQEYIPQRPGTSCQPSTQMAGGPYGESVAV